MMKKLSFLLPVEGFRRTLTRFPLSSACSIGLFVIVLLFIHEVLDKDDELIGKFALSICLGYFWFGAAKLFAEARGIANVLHMFVSLLVFCVPEWGPTNLFMRDSAWVFVSLGN